MSEFPKVSRDSNNTKSEEKIIQFVERCEGVFKHKIQDVDPQIIQTDIQVIKGETKVEVETILVESKEFYLSNKDLLNQKKKHEEEKVMKKNIKQQDCEVIEIDSIPEVVQKVTRSRKESRQVKAETTRTARKPRTARNSRKRPATEVAPPVRRSTRSKTKRSRR